MKYDVSTCNNTLTLNVNPRFYGLSHVCITIHYSSKIISTFLYNIVFKSVINVSYTCTSYCCYLKDAFVNWSHQTLHIDDLEIHLPNPSQCAPYCWKESKKDISGVLVRSTNCQRHLKVGILIYEVNCSNFTSLLQYKWNIYLTLNNTYMYKDSAWKLLITMTNNWKNITSKLVSQPLGLWY